LHDVPQDRRADAVKRFLALLLAILLVAAVAFSGRNSASRSVAAMCTPHPTSFQIGTMVASRFGSVVPALQKPIPTGKIVELAKGAWWTVGYWLGVFTAAANGHPAPDPAIAPVDCSALLNDPCVTTPPSAGGQDPSKLASLALGGGNPAVANTAPLSGADLAADALSKAGFDPKEIPTFVAIAKAESGFRRDAWNNYGAGMAGMWQLNQAYWKLANWQDPYANAVMAKKVRDESVAKGANPYAPWSTWRGAVANAGQYAKYASISNSPTPNTTTPAIPLDPVTGAITAPACNPAVSGGAVGGPDTVGQWNILFSNSTANVNAGAGFADLVCLNELRSQKVRVPGYQVSPFSSAVEILWRTAKLEQVEVHRNTTLTGYARDKSAVWGVWKSKTTGKQFGAICTHQLVQGGTGWAKQAAHVNEIRSRLVSRGLPVVLLGDMNASGGRISAAFGGQPGCVRIICAVSYGMKPVKTEVLARMGSDHPRVRFTFPQSGPAAAPPAPVKPHTTGPVTNGAAGIREIAGRHNATYVSPHRDPQGLSAFDIGSSGAKNTAIAEDLRVHHSQIGARYVISQMRIASARSNWNWRPYSPITSAGDFRHEGHVHVSY
jgi:hypothetical protein